MSDCPKCGEKIEFDGEVLKCTECASVFSLIEQTIKMSTEELPTVEGMILVDSNKFQELRDDEDETDGKYSPEWYAKEMGNPNSPLFIPAGAITYSNADGSVLVSHIERQARIQIPKEDTVQPKSHIPESAVRVVEGNEHIIVEKMDGRGESKIIDSITNMEELMPQEPRQAPTRLKMGDIAKKLGYTIEQRAIMMKNHGYSDTAIKKWRKKVELEEEKLE